MKIECTDLVLILLESMQQTTRYYNLSVLLKMNHDPLHRFIRTQAISS